MQAWASHGKAISSPECVYPVESTMGTMVIEHRRQNYIGLRYWGETKSTYASSVLMVAGKVDEVDGQPQTLALLQTITAAE